MDDHDRLLDRLLATHSLFGAFDPTSDEHFLVQVWDPPPADADLPPGPGDPDPWANLAIRRPWTTPS